MGRWSWSKTNHFINLPPSDVCVILVIPMSEVLTTSARRAVNHITAEGQTAANRF